MQKDFNSALCHQILFNKVQPKLSYTPDCDFLLWKKAIKEKWTELLGLDEIAKNACPPRLTIDWEEKKEGYTQTRFTFESEIGETVPCYLLTPDTGKAKYPVVILLQGHSSGFHLSVGEKKWKEDEAWQPRKSFALQAVKHGFAALAIEQRGLGERRSKLSYGEENVYYGRPHMCAVAALNAFALGRTILGERVWDISKAIDLLPNFPQCDTEKITVAGISGGGTATFYAGCYDERIKLVVPCCAFSSYKTSIFAIEHCLCNYIPSVWNWFDMQDLACLVAPRNLLIVTGQKDEIFPVTGVRSSYETVKGIYARAGVEDKCRLVETPSGHHWCEDIVWTAINEECKKLGWK